MRQIEKRLLMIEEGQNPKEKPSLKVFTQSVSGNITGMGLEFKNRAEYDIYAEEQGFNEGDKINSVLFVTICNARDQGSEEY